MSEIDYEIRSASGLVGELRSYPQHYTAAHEAADRIETLQAELRAAYANCHEEVEKIKADQYTELAKRLVIPNSGTTARDWMIAMAEDIDRAIRARAALEGKDG